MRACAFSEFPTAQFVVCDAIVLAPFDAPVVRTSDAALCPLGTTLAELHLCRARRLWCYRDCVARHLARVQRPATGRDGSEPARASGALTGATPARVPRPKPNDICGCGSQLKYKRCCGRLR